MTKTSSQISLSLLVGKPRKKRLGNAEKAQYTRGVLELRSKIQLAQQDVPTVSDVVVNLEFAFALDQLLASFRVALAQHVDHKVAEDEVSNQRRNAKIETGESV